MRDRHPAPVPCLSPTLLATILAALPLAGCSGGKDSAGDSTVDSAPRDDSGDSGDSGTPGTVELGAICPIEGKIGEIVIISQGMPYLSGQVFDRPNPWHGPAAEETDTCAFHRFDPDSCGGCPDGQVCGQDGACADQPRAATDLEVELIGAASATFTADPVTGQVFGEPPAGAGYETILRFGGHTVEIPEIAMAPGGLDYALSLEGDSSAPGAMDIAWTPGSDGSTVRTHLNINHHAAGPTFTTCAAPVASGAIHATATMIDPLAVVTGLEFQGVENSNTAAVWVEAGCVELRYGTFDFVMQP